jgi:hypothetical protein
MWPGQTVTCLHTNRPGHIWTTLYNRGINKKSFWKMSKGKCTLRVVTFIAFCFCRPRRLCFFFLVLRSILVLTQIGNLWVVPLFHSVSEINVLVERQISQLNPPPLPRVTYPNNRNCHESFWENLLLKPDTENFSSCKPLWYFRYTSSESADKCSCLTRLSPVDTIY